MFMLFTCELFSPDELTKCIFVLQDGFAPPEDDNININHPEDDQDEY